MGDACNNCLQAIEKIKQIPGYVLTEVSSFYTTEPVGVQDQDWYVNGVVSISVDISAQTLISDLLSIEENMGRVRKEKWESRVIDLDILLYGEDIIQKENLSIPHPLMHERRFVLTPMVDLAPELIHPILKKSMKELLKAIKEDGQVVKRIEDS